MRLALGHDALCHEGQMAWLLEVESDFARAAQLQQGVVKKMIVPIDHDDKVECVGARRCQFKRPLLDIQDRRLAEMRAPAKQNPFDGRPARRATLGVRGRIIRLGFRFEIMGEHGQRPHRQLQKWQQRD
jgi:hypothetical protein